MKILNLTKMFVVDLDDEVSKSHREYKIPVTILLFIALVLTSYSCIILALLSYTR